MSTLCQKVYAYICSHGGKRQSKDCACAVLPVQDIKIIEQEEITAFLSTLSKVCLYTVKTQQEVTQRHIFQTELFYLSSQNFKFMTSDHSKSFNQGMIMTFLSVASLFPFLFVLVRVYNLSKCKNLVDRRFLHSTAHEQLWHLLGLSAGPSHI